MIRIVLLCAGGMSTSFLVQNMNKAIARRGLEAQVKARGEAELLRLIDEVDVVLLAPQARYGEAKCRQVCQERGKPFGLVDSMVYGTMNGEAALDAALALLECE